MNLFIHITARIIPAAAVAAAGIYGWAYWQEPDRIKKGSASKGKKQMSIKRTKGTKRPKTAAPRIRGLKTKFLPFEQTEYQIQLRSQGIVKAPEVTAVTAQVSGRITEVSENFVAGAFVKKGDILARIDTADFEVAIVSAEASLARAKANLAQEKARGEQALRNWQDIGFKEEPNELVLRKPQLREAEANVKSAQASLERAARNKTRCEIVAPFSGVIRNRQIGLGSVIGGNSKLGEVLSTDFAEVRLPLSQTQLDILEESPDQQPKVTFINALKPNSGKTWTGQIVRTESEMDLSSRELYLIARIKDPFSLEKTHTHPLKFNLPVMASMPAKIVKNVYLVNREHIQGIRDIVTINDKKRIKRVKLQPLWEDESQLIISADSIPKGSVLATTLLPYATDGARVTLINEDGFPIEDPRKKQPKEEKPPSTAQIKK